LNLLCANLQILNSVVYLAVLKVVLDLITMPVGKLNPFDPSTDDFEAWTEILAQYLLANDVDKVKDSKKALAIFLSSVGVSTYTLLKTLCSPDLPETKKLDALIIILGHYFKPPPKAISERFKFFGRKQVDGESVTVYLYELRRLALTCKFENLNISLRDQFIFGLRSESAQKRLFIEDDSLTLQNAVSIATSQEAAEASTQLVRSAISSSSLVEQSAESTNKVHSGKKPFHSGGGNFRQAGKQSCPNCGNSHFKSDCQFKHITCRNCNKKGHFAKFCRSPKSSDPGQVHSNQLGEFSEYSDVDSVNQLSRAHNTPIEVQVSINGNIHQMELDTGSGKSFVNPKFWKSIGSPKLSVCSVKFRTFTGECFEAHGQFPCLLKYNGQQLRHVLYVANGSSLFGRDLIRKFNMDWKDIKAQCSQVNNIHCDITLNSLLTEFVDVFDKPVGKIANFKAKLVLKDDAVPRFCKARPVPFALREKVDAELQKMEKAGILERVEHSEWASPLVCVPKPNGKVRITGDFKRTINNQLCVTQYPLSRVEDLFECVSGGCTFSKLDGSDAFHQVEIDDCCKKYLVINTHRGLFRYNVLPQGIASSPAIFQELMDRMLKDVPMSGSFIDDCICSGRTDSQHLQHLREIFERVREWNYRLSRKKCVFMQKQVTFLGHCISKQGIQTDPDKVEAIKSMREPTTVSEVKSFLGLVNFYGKFIPKMSHLCEPLNNLTRDNVKWCWTGNCRHAFDEIKKCVSRSPLLANFDQSVPVGIACDASSVGLGAVLFHKYPDGSERPIAFASKSLSDAERKYSQIEKEGLSIVFGIKKFTQYLYGRRFSLETDHHPLLSIFGDKSDLPSLVANRLHRWSVFLSGFSYSIVYRNTNRHGNADALSRLPLPQNLPVDLLTDVEVKSLIEDKPVNSKMVRLQTAKDPTLSKVVQCVQNRWPSQLNQVPVEIRPYFPRRSEFYVQDGILMCRLRVVVPLPLRSSVMNALHSSHSGIVRMKSIARQHVWWPGIDLHIEQLTKSCQSCSAHQDNPAVAPLHPWLFPEKPWQRIHVDLAGPFLNKMWLIIVDAHSKWPEVFNLNHNTTSQSVICCIRETFSRHGIPETIVSDNGPQFVSTEFNSFCSSNGVRHTTSSAYHPRSNGEAERFVRTFKNAMERAYVKNKNLNLSLCNFLLTYRTTSHATTGVPPAELMINRKLKTILDLLHPNVFSNVQHHQERQQEQFNNKSKVREFANNQSVWVQTFSLSCPKWSRGVVVKKLGPVTYDVKVDGRVIKRHVDHILALSVPNSDEIDVPAPEVGSSLLSPDEPSTNVTPASSPVRDPHTSRPVSPDPAPDPIETPPTISDPIPEDLNLSRFRRPVRITRKPDRLNTSSFK